MHSRVESGTLTDVTHEQRGKDITRRRLAHGLRSVREFAERTGLSREAVTKAEAGTASEGTYQRLESWLDAFDEEVGDDTRQPDAPLSNQLVTFEVEGLYGVGKFTVAGPPDEADANEERFARLLDRIIKAQRGEGDDPQV